VVHSIVAFCAAGNIIYQFAASFRRSFLPIRFEGCQKSVNPLTVSDADLDKKSKNNYVRNNETVYMLNIYCLIIL